MRENHRGLGLFTLLVYIFLLGPLLIIGVASFEPGTILKFPPQGFSFKWYQHIFEVEMFMKTFRTSVLVSFVGNVLALLLGIPAAYALSGLASKARTPGMRSLFRRCSSPALCSALSC